MTETIWPPKPKIFTTWPFTEKGCCSLVYTIVRTQQCLGCEGKCEARRKKGRKGERKGGRRFGKGKEKNRYENGKNRERE